MNNQNTVDLFQRRNNVGGASGECGLLIGCCAETLVFLLLLYGRFSVLRTEMYTIFLYWYSEDFSYQTNFVPFYKKIRKFRKLENSKPL